MEVTPENINVEPSATAPRGWRGYLLRPRRMILFLVIVNLSILAAALWREPRITVSRETTFLVEPLDNEGFVDYLAAVNQRWSRGVTPENNAAVLLAQALDPKEVWESIYDEFYADLQVAKPTAGAVHLPDYYQFVYVKFTEEIWNEAHSELQQAIHRPWTDPEFPLIAVWIDQHAADIDLGLAASSRSRFYAPFYSGEPLNYGDAGTPLLVINSSNALLWRLAWALAARAMRRLDQHDPTGAWSDLLAIHRLARLNTECPWTLARVQSHHFDRIAIEATCALIQSPLFTEELATKIQKDLDGLPPRTPFVQTYGEHERFRALERVQKVFRQGTAGWVGPDQESLMARFELWAMRRIIDWDRVLIRTNDWFDRWQAIGAMQPPSKRRAATRLFLDEIGQLETKFKDQPQFRLGRDAPGQQTAIRFAGSSGNCALGVEKMWTCGFALCG